MATRKRTNAPALGFTVTTPAGEKSEGNSDEGEQLTEQELDVLDATIDQVLADNEEADE